MSMMSWVCGHNRRDKIRNKGICERLGWSQCRIIRGTEVQSLGLFEYVKGRCTYAPVWSCERLIMDSYMIGRGTQKSYWGEVIRQDMTQLQLTKDMILKDYGGHKLGQRVSLVVCKLSCLVLHTISRRITLEVSYYSTSVTIYRFQHFNYHINLWW